MDIPNQKLERKMMAENTVAMTITDDGYRQIAEMTIINVLDNVKTNKDWSRTKRGERVLIITATLLLMIVAVAVGTIETM